MFLDATAFPFTRVLEERWRAVRGELTVLPASDFAPWPERGLYDSGWSVFGLIAFGRRLDENLAACPETARVLREVPGLTTAGFSRLAPGAHIRPHVGYTDAVLRCHLGLVVPPDGCALRVAGEERAWEEGRCLVFDDTAVHEAWNRSSLPRVVLLADFLRPGADPRAVAIPPSLR